MSNLIRGRAVGAGGRALVISDGDLPGLLATAIATEETVRRENLRRMPDPLIWSAWHDEAPAVARERAVRGHAASLGARHIETPHLPREAEEGEGSWQSRLLMRAGVLALANGCRRVVWPVVFESGSADEPASVELISGVLSRAVLVSRLISMEVDGTGLPEVVVETPFVDLSDGQVAELAAEMGLSVEDCWWWSDTATPAANRARSRWGRVTAGIA